MHHLTIHLTDQRYQELLGKARTAGLSIDAYIKTILFDLDSGVFTPKEALLRARKKYEVEDLFELRELYSQEEWQELSRGERIAFGRSFFTYTSEIETGFIQLIPNSGCNGKRAQYKLLRK